MTIQTVNVASPNYRPGRSSAPRLIVLHTAECGCQAGAAVSTARYLANPTVRASAHWVVGPDLAVAQVAESDTAWAAPGANSDGIQIEQTAYAGWSTEWRGGGQLPLDMLRNTAEVMAGISQRWGIPLVHLTNEQLAAGQAGVIGHVQASEVYQQSDHWDPGPDYPYDYVLDLARQFAGGLEPADTPAASPLDPLEELMASPEADALRKLITETHDVVVSKLGTHKVAGLDSPPAMSDTWAQANHASSQADVAVSYVTRLGQAINGLGAKVDAITAATPKSLKDYSNAELFAEVDRRLNTSAGTLGAV